MSGLFTATKPINVLLRNCIKNESKVCARGVKDAAKNTYKNTVFLPQTQFPTRLNGEKRLEMDNYLLEKCEFAELYKWQRENLPGPDFVLHDGPPYANGSLHMGHAINKILKDITLRVRVIRGQRVHYVPGWDCHGLPIELKALSSSASKSMGPLEIRNKARNFAYSTVENQRDGFLSWGIMADWKTSGCYFTYDNPYIKNQLLQFLNMYDKGLIFRDFKPVHWSPSSRTALAEAELEYHPTHESTAAYVRLRISKLPSKLKTFESRNIYALTWTTTPWTLIANQALAFSPDATYCVAEDSNANLYIVAMDLLQSIQQQIGPLNPVISITGNELHEAEYLQPITKKSLKFYPGDHVTVDLGTGLVHTAPAHGPEDFLVALENKLPILSLVNDEGQYNEKAGDGFVGLDVLTDGTAKILQCMGEDILKAEKFVHSYPYDWRTKKPVIMRASQQWFIDVNAIKNKAIENIANIEIYPKQKREQFMNVLTTQVKKRPYWCISRQRSWGTPIPVFYYKDSGKIFMNRDWMDRFCELVEQHSPDCWWTQPVEKLLGQELLEKFNVHPDDLEKGADIMDIWFDSGISWSVVLPDKKADIYMEGVDQFSGWFQSSLLTSVALQGCAPYRTLFVHGFAVDENAAKMSKSQGNVVSPETVMKGGKNLNKNPVYGIDVLRWWVASHGCQHSQVPVSETLLSGCREEIQKLRLVLRFLLGVLHPQMRLRANLTSEPDYLHLDKYMLHCLYNFHEKCQQFYDNYQYHHVCMKIVNFVANEVSSTYCHLTKDRLYCDDIASPYRVAAVEVTEDILIVLARTLAPILPHLSEEVWLHYPENLASVSLFRTKNHVPDSWYQPEINEIVTGALRIRHDVNKLATKNTWELAASIIATKQDYALLSNLQQDIQSSTSELCEITQVSSVELIEDPTLEKTEVKLYDLDITLCKRCRRHPEENSSDLCKRCATLVNNVSRPSAFN